MNKISCAIQLKTHRQKGTRCRQKCCPMFRKVFVGEIDAKSEGRIEWNKHVTEYEIHCTTKTVPNENDDYKGGDRSPIRENQQNKGSSLKHDLAFLKQLESLAKKEERYWNRIPNESNDKPKPKRNFQSHPLRLSESSDSLEYSPEDNDYWIPPAQSKFNLPFRPPKTKSFLENKVKQIKKQLHDKLTLAGGNIETFKEANIGDGVNKAKLSMNDDEAKPKEKKKVLDMTRETGSKKFKKEDKIHDRRENKMKSTSGRNLQKQVKMASSPTSAEMNHIAKHRKISFSLEKCILLLKDISQSKGDVVPPDGFEDLLRRNNREREFSSRFSRNYLYALGRQITDLKGMEKTHHIVPKVVSSVQTLQRGLEAFVHYMPFVVNVDAFNLIKNLVKDSLLLIDIYEVHAQKQTIVDNDEHIKIFRDIGHEVLKKFECVTLGSPSSLEKSSMSRISLAATSKLILSKKSSMSSMKNRLAMYHNSAPIKKGRQSQQNSKKVSERKKKSVKSKYKTASFKHRPPLEKDEKEKEIPQQKLDDQKKSPILKPPMTPVLQTLNEDDIPTMVQQDPDNDELKEHITYNTTEESNPEDEKEQVDNSNVLTKLLELVQDGEGKDKEGSTINLTKTIEALQECLNVKKKNADIFKKLLMEHEKGIKANVEESEEEDKAHNEPSVTVTGVKNAKLYCIRDGSLSQIDESDDPKTSKDITPAETLVKKEDSKAEPKENITSHSAAKVKKTKLSRIISNSRPLKLLPKDYAINIIQYKLQFHNYCKGNYMYRKTKVPPWILLDRISEKILDFALLGIAKEIEVNEILENMYKSEFQL